MVKSPLTTIIENIELFLMKYTDMDEIMEQKLKIVLNESKRIGKIIEKFRDAKKVVVKKNYLEITGE